MQSILVLITLTGCHPQRPYSESSPDAIPSSLVVVTNQVLRDYWQAAMRHDSTTVVAMSSNRQPVEWIREERDTEGDFAIRAMRKFVIRQVVYYPSATQDGVMMHIEVPWYRCGPPVHRGVPDEYYIRLVPIRGAWRVANIWREPCADTQPSYTHGDSKNVR